MIATPLHLMRVAILPSGAWGVLKWFGQPICVTLEHTYEGIRDPVRWTKIAPGRYTCERTRYHRGGYDTWLIVGGDVTPQRRIMIHKGNDEDDSSGCVLVGEQYQPLNGRPAIQQSGKAFDELMLLSTDYDELELLVTNV